MLQEQTKRSKKTKIRLDTSAIVIKVVGYTLITAFALTCLLPFWLMVMGSITKDSVIRTVGFALIPSEFSFKAYTLTFEHPKFLMGSYILTITNMVVGTVLGMFFTSMAAYALQRPDFAWRNKISLYFYFTMLFSGGMVPYYLLMVRYLGLKNNYLSILLPSMVTAWNIIMMKNFMRGIPHSLTESGLIDGAGDFTIYLRIFMPMSAPSLATIGLFLALGYWNEWWNAMMFLETSSGRFIPLQYFLYNMVNRADYLRQSAAQANIPPQDTPGESLKMAAAVLSTGPIILVYPFVQRFFISGITIGAVKG